MRITQEQLDNWFTYHNDPAKVPLYQAIREAEDNCRKVAWDVLQAIEMDQVHSQPIGDQQLQELFGRINQITKTFAEVIVANCPGCADASAAVRCVRLVRMALNEQLRTRSVGVNHLIYDQILLARFQASAAIALDGK